jgi:DNA topoisomerase-1
MASQMSNAKYEVSSVKISAGDYRFTASASLRSFDGYMLVYTEADQEKDEKKNAVMNLTEDTKLSFDRFDEKQHFTQPPAHFTEASLVHTLEELGIGRPSTYAPTISTLLKRHYVTKEGRNIFMTELGDAVNTIMKKSFPTIVDEQFTANMEGLLDGVEEGTVDWKSIVLNFYPDLEASVKKAEEDLEKVNIADEQTDVVCENCGRHMVIKYGPHGKFLACPGFPECRNTKPYLEKINVPCPKCNKDIVIRKTRKGRVFYGCEDYPNCDFMSWQRPVEKKCPKCGNYMVIRGNKLVCSNQECGYSETKDNK